MELDPEPHVFKDEVGAELVGEEGWRNRPDMDPAFSKPMRASVVGRARFVEDLVEREAEKGIPQYVILGAGLDTFAQRKPGLASRLQVFEVDQPGPQAWKRKRLSELGIKTPDSLRFVPVDFEAGQSWRERLVAVGFDERKPAVIVSTGVSMYLTKEANLTTLRQAAGLAPGSTLAMTFMLSLDRLGAEERSTMEFVMGKAKASGTPFLSLFSPHEITALAGQAGFKCATHVSGEDIRRRYFAGRADGLDAGDAEAFLVAET